MFSLSAVVSWAPIIASETPGGSPRSGAALPPELAVRAPGWAQRTANAIVSLVSRMPLYMLPSHRISKPTAIITPPAGGAEIINPLGPY